MALYNFNAAYSLAEDLYDLTPDEAEFESIAMDGWERIGNRHTRLYRYTADVQDGRLTLPCNVDLIESVTIPMVDAQVTSNKADYAWINNSWVEYYIDFLKHGEDPYYSYGKYVKYDEGDGVLYFTHDYHHVSVLYHGIIVDDESGLPLLNNKELRAVATYIAYVTLYKESIRKRDGNLLKMAQIIKDDWLHLCNAARIPEHFSQNDMDRILDVRVRWDRKMFNKSGKPII